MKHVHRVQVASVQPEMTLSGAEVRHLRVMRLRPGDGVEVFDGAGASADAVITELDELRATLHLNGARQDEREYPQSVTLALALLKGDKLADVVRAATELGAAQIQLLRTRYADVPDIGEQKLLRLRRVAAEAAKQSRRAVIPPVHAPMPLPEYRPAGQVFFAHPGSQNTLPGALSWQSPITLITGPEGGFSDEEASLLSGYAAALTLGPRILRAETAPIALLGALAASGL